MNRSHAVTVCAATCLVMVLTFLMAPAHLAADPIVEQSTISFGQTVSDTIAAPGETDNYIFTANSGDLILIGMSRVSDPDGARFRDAVAADQVVRSRWEPARRKRGGHASRNDTVTASQR